MNRFRKGTIAMVSLGLLVLAPLSVASAASDKVTVENLRGPLINAYFTAVDPTGCVETDTFVTANRPTYQQLPGRGTTTVVGGVSIFQYDSCTDTVLLPAVGEIEPSSGATFQLSRQLLWASLKAEVTLTNIDTNATFPVSVDVALVSTGPIHRDTENSNDRYGRNCHVLNRWKGTGRDAVATGTVSDGVTNFTPTASQPAEIGLVIDGFEVIGCA